MTKFATIFLVFFILTPVGTLLHEMGHCLTVLYYDGAPTLHYGSTTYNINYPDHQGTNISINLPLWGILSTLFIGTSGFILAIANKAKPNILLIGIYLAFFWSRELVVLFVSLFVKKGLGTDEVRVANVLQLPQYTLATTLAIIATIILYYCVFILLPKALRIRFITAGLLGSLLGWIFWFLFLGPIVLP